MKRTDKSGTWLNMEHIADQRIAERLSLFPPHDRARPAVLGLERGPLFCGRVAQAKFHLPTSGDLTRVRPVCRCECFCKNLVAPRRDKRFLGFKLLIVVCPVAGRGSCDGQPGGRVGRLARCAEFAAKISASAKMVKDMHPHVIGHLARKPHRCQDRAGGGLAGGAGIPHRPSAD